MRYARKVLFVHPAALRVYARTFGWRLKHGRVPSGSQWVCSLCHARGHVGRCRRAALARVEAATRAFFATNRFVTGA